MDVEIDRFKEKIIDYIQTESRNKIVIHKDEFPSITHLNVGYELAKGLSDLSLDNHFAVKAQGKLDLLLKNAIITHNEYGEILPICNLGILFEKELKINFASLIEQHSKDVCLFVNWEGKADRNSLFFLSKEKGVKINIENLSHIIL